jgi:hypothetical protein
MKSPKSPKMSSELLFVPLYLRSFNVSEKVIIVLLILLSSLTVGLLPIVYGLTDTSKQSTTPIYSSEAELWRVFGKSN